MTKLFRRTSFRMSVSVSSKYFVAFPLWKLNSEFQTSCFSWTMLPKSLGHPDSGFLEWDRSQNETQHTIHIHVAVTGHGDWLRYIQTQCCRRHRHRFLCTMIEGRPDMQRTDYIYIYIYTRPLVREETRVYNTTVSLSVVVGGGPGSARAGTVSLRSGNGSPPVTFLVWPSRLRRQWPRGGRGKFPGQLILPPSPPFHFRDGMSCREAAVI